MNSESTVRSWLDGAPAIKDLDTYSIKIGGSSEKGDGYVGDIVFLSVLGTRNGEKVNYELVLKCSKNSKALAEKNPEFREAFLREIYVYDQIFPYFNNFEISKGISKPFNSFPKFLGHYIDDSRQVIILENIKQKGFDLNDKAKPLTIEHLELVVQEYAKFHAISAALKEENNHHFEKIIQNIDTNVVKLIFTNSDFVAVFQSAIEELGSLLKNELEPQVLDTWLKFKEQVYHVTCEMQTHTDDLSVVCHGDCWNNNFMYSYNKNIVEKVSILDWQMSKYFSPVSDLSYFLFSCISPENLENLENVLRLYHDTLINRLEQLGATALISRYTFDVFLKEWTKYAKFGLIMCILAIKVPFFNNEKIPDIAESVEIGGNISTSFAQSIEDTEGYKNRLKPLILYAIQNHII